MTVCTSTRSKQLWIGAETANQVNWLFQIGGPDPTLKFWVIFFATTVSKNNSKNCNLHTVHKKKILSPSPAAIVEIEPIFFANFPCPPLYLEAQRYLIAL